MAEFIEILSPSALKDLTTANNEVVKLISNINSAGEAMKTIKRLINERIEGSGAKILSADTALYSDDFIMSQDGQEFGCSSYVDVYQEESLPSPQLEGNIRPCGCHIHIGYNIESNPLKLDDYQINIAIGKAMDYFVGIPSDKIHYSKYRRNNYGKFGSIRMTAYGLEYRSLGGYFTNDEFLAWQFQQTKKAVEFVSNIDNYEKLSILTCADEKFYDFLEINLDEQIPTIVTNLVKKEKIC